MMSIVDNLNKIKSELRDSVRLVAVSKTKPLSDIEEAYKAGQRIFGENKVQELTEKHESLPDDIQWHMIGHLQTNKVKYIAPFVSMIQSVDSLKLLKIINKEAKKNNRVIKCLFQFFIANETTKFGMNKEEAEDIFSSDEFAEMENVEISGVMGVSTNTSDKDQIHREFHDLKQIFDDLKSEYFNKNQNFCELSMGMSHDFKIAQEEGSTIVRVGSLIFGNRNYNI
ncbi:MAG: YggS family pyridoxal phosphate-dependent enzyme [Prolixibacteraceae bacterium]|nr:YggS family pyridoxal phosphate-dependent enzyme [Prolixibacteraceae bacterium]